MLLEPALKMLSEQHHGGLVVKHERLSDGRKPRLRPYGMDVPVDDIGRTDRGFPTGSREITRSNVVDRSTFRESDKAKWSIGD
jgi:hypothetical protein